MTKKNEIPRIFNFTRDSEIGQRLIALCKAYKENGDSGAIGEAYRLVQSEIERKAQWQSTVFPGINVEDYIGELNVAFVEAFDSYNEDGGACFTSFLNLVLNRKVYTLNSPSNPYRRYKRHCTLAYVGKDGESVDGEMTSNVPIAYDGGYLPSAGSSNITVDHFDQIPSTQNVEAIVLDGMMVEEQRKLIKYIYDNAPEKDREDAHRFMEILYCGAPGMSDKELREFSRQLVEDPAATRNKVAKICGVHHTRVNRVLKRLRRLYDPKKFGEIEDYRFRIPQLYPRLGEAGARCTLPPGERRKRKQDAEAKATKTTRKRGKRARSDRG